MGETRCDHKFSLRVVVVVGDWEQEGRVRRVPCRRWAFFVEKVWLVQDRAVASAGKAIEQSDEAKWE